MNRHQYPCAKQRNRTVRQGPSPIIQGLLGSALRQHQAGQLIEAERIYRKILEIDAHDADGLHLLGVIAYQSGQHEAAVELIRKAIALNDKAASYHSNLGNALQAQGKLDEAAIGYKRALLLKPDLAEAHINLGNILQVQGKLDDSVACYERALALTPDHAEAYNNLGNTLQAQDKLDGAVACYERALAIEPGYATAHYNLGYVLCALGNAEGSLLQYRKALALQPDYAQAGFGEALAQLLQGDFVAGWRNFERRWQIGDYNTARRSYPQPLWTGDMLPSGRVLIWGEQGVGDEIMFAGLLPEVLRAGNRCILDCDARLEPLFARSFPGIEVVSGVAADSRFDFAAHLPSGSLPGLFRTNAAAFASTTSPYLVADSVARERFRALYADGRRLIGVAWHTKNQKTGRNRSIDLAWFAPLFKRSDLRWVSLQYGDHDALVAQVAAAGAPILIDRSFDQLSNIDCFAAQVAAMDMVVTIDNSTAHLAGALGVPVWVLLPSVPDWRWLETREDSPWYPTMRLFRQAKLGDWPSVVEEVHDALRVAITSP
jgi:tetratricopeptide (TPR) repeat protein